MSRPTWDETVIAGKLFAILTYKGALRHETGGFKSLSIDHGVLTLETLDGREFEITVHELPQNAPVKAA